MSDLFDAILSKLIEQYAGMYVLFEDGTVIDADIDEDVLRVGVLRLRSAQVASPFLRNAARWRKARSCGETKNRVWETDFVRDRIAKYHGIFCHLVPI